MHRISILLGGILLLMIIDLNLATKHHRDRGHNRHEDETLLDKQERERDKKDRKKNDNTETNRNLTCYKCDGDLCRDPFQSGLDTPVVQCEHSCWKGVFVASIRRSCGSKRCTFAFQGGSAISNTCCQTSFCNNTPRKIPSMMMIILSSFIIRIWNNLNIGGL